MTRLFLASALACAAALQLLESPGQGSQGMGLGSALDLFGLEALDIPGALEAGLIEVDSAGALGPGGEWRGVPVESWEPVLGEGAPFQAVQHSWLVPLDASSAEAPPSSLNAELVRRGLAIGHVVTAGPGSEGYLAELATAAASAQAAGAGIWASRDLAPKQGRRLAFAPLPEGAAPKQSIAGIALPMHHKQEFQTYERELTEIAGLGAQWVNLIVATRIEQNDSLRVPLTSDRTPSDDRIRATIDSAHALGLGVQLMPIVLIKDPGPKDWRGTLKPTDPDMFWRSYDRFICHMADLASETSAEVFCIGSELASLESDKAQWQRIITNIRMRYRGQLTYSANWDHFAKVPFWSELDFASMTAYFTLCKTAQGPATQADYDCVAEGWANGLFEAWRLSRISRLPVVFSEVGVPSATGALAAPWDYTLDTEVDLEAQRLAFEAFHKVLTPNNHPAKGFNGAFLYDYWGQGGPQDKTYTPRGKPALKEWRKILSALSTN
jgi:hypothetical protein